MSNSNRHDWLKRDEKHTSLAHTARRLKEEQIKKEDAESDLVKAKGEIDYWLELYKKQLDELAFIELPEDKEAA